MSERERRKNVDVFSEGILCILTIRCWGASSKLDDKHFGEKMPKELVNASYSLLENKTILEDLHSMRNKAKRFLDRVSLPFPIDGIAFIPKMAIEEIDVGLKRWEKQFNERLEDLMMAYDQIKKSYAEKYPHLYKPEKYPTKEVLRERFCFEWSFRQLQVPSQENSVLSPLMLEEERKKFKNDMTKMRNMAVSAVGQQFISKIESLKKQCLGEKINTQTIDGLADFFDRFERLWGTFVSHKDLKNVIAKAKKYMNGTDAEMLRADEGFRRYIGEKMEKITDEFDKIADVRLKRKLVF